MQGFQKRRDNAPDASPAFQQLLIVHGRERLRGPPAEGL
jgi:hypothetical protein